ncbi:MAG: hypothetical protein F6J93_21130 [Oscillatoria sp. SIO1A7]|nr:hypothetical protein [Oscillatoria sp. SIO1A7]
MVASQDNLTACVVCSDRDEKRQLQWVELLRDKFSEVYVIFSDSRCEKFTPGQKEGRSIATDQLPPVASVAFVHVFDATLSQEFGIQSDWVFKFTTSGDPELQDGELAIFRPNSPGDLGIAASDIEETVAYISKRREQPPSMCFPTILMGERQEIVTGEQRQKVLHRLCSVLAKKESAPELYRSIYRLIGQPKPIVYVLDDYNNYIVCSEGIYQPNPNLSDRIYERYCYEAEVSINNVKEALRGFCLMLNNLSLAFTVKTPPLWIADRRQPGYELVYEALPIPELHRDRSQIAAFIIDLEWLPALTGRSETKEKNRQNWKKMGSRAIDILSDLYPEIPSFIFTGLQPSEEVQEALARGASWGFYKEKTHHYARERAASKQLAEQLTYINFEQQLTRTVAVRYGSYEEVPFPEQLALNSSTPAGRQLIKQLKIKPPIGSDFPSLALQKAIAGLLPAATLVEPVKVISTGKSLAQATFFVKPTFQGDRLATRFIKIAPWLSIQKEYQAYQRVIQPRLNSYTASLVQKPILTGDNSPSGEMPWGALMYSLAGFPEEYQNLYSLNELLELQIEKVGGDVFLLERLSNTLDKVLWPLYQSGISKPAQKQPLWRWLGNVLPSLYTGVLVPLPLVPTDLLPNLAPLATDKSSAKSRAKFSAKFRFVADGVEQEAIALSSHSARGYKQTTAWTLASFDLVRLNSELEKQEALQNPSPWDDEILNKSYRAVLLLDWHLEAVQWQAGEFGNGSITLAHPDLGMRVFLRGRGEDIRLRFGATWIRPGMPVTVLACLDAKSKELAKIEKKIQASLSALNWNYPVAPPPQPDAIAPLDSFESLLSCFQEKNSLGERKLTSPFKVFCSNSLLPHRYTISGHVGPIHGDLNLNNILYPASETVGWLIDFELVKEQGMIAFDLAKLEVEIWIHHLAPYLGAIATLSSDMEPSCYRLLYWTLQALDFPGDEAEFLKTKLKGLPELSTASDALLLPATNALKVIKALRCFGLEKCKLTLQELKWALAAYFFNAAKFQSQTQKFKTTSACSSIFAFIASAWHLDAVLPYI